MNGLPLGIDFQQIFLHFFNFLILALGLYILLYKPVNSFIEKRKEYYESLDKNIEDKNRESSKILEENEAKLQNIEAEIESIKKKAKDDADLKAEKIIESANLKADEIINAAREKGILEKNKLIEEANSEIKEIAINTARKILENDGDDYDNFINAAKGEIKNENR